MEIILLERVENLGAIGDIVTVRPGFARNYLLPQGKALRATKANLAHFESQRAALEALNDSKKAAAEKLSGEIGELTVILVRQASEGGQLYGSVNARDIAGAVVEAGHKIERSQVVQDGPIKTLGLFPVTLSLHPEVKLSITVNVARSEEEAAMQLERGGALIGIQDEDEDEAELEAAAESSETETESDAESDAETAEGDAASESTEDTEAAA